MKKNYLSLLLVVLSIFYNYGQCLPDVTPPTAVCQNISVNLDASGNASITPAQIDNGSSDVCTAVTLGLDQTTFDCSNIGANTVTLTVTDVAGNSSQCTATVTVVDNIDPVNPNLSTITAQCSATVPVPTTTDNCSGIITGTTTNPLSYNIQGAHNIDWTFTDDNGNSITLTQTIFINDTTDPTSVCKDITIQLDDINGTATITPSQLDNGSSDNCNYTTTISKSTFDCSNIGDNFITFSVTDDNGNSDICIAKVTVTSPNINGGTLTGYLENTETIADADEIIEVTACPENEQKNARFNLLGESGTISRWEYSINGGLNWITINNTSNSYYFTNILQTTLIRAVVTIGSCEASSSIVLATIIPPDNPPTIVGPETIDNCIGTPVTIIAESSYGVTPDFNEGGKFNEANLNTLGWTVDGEADMSAGGSNTNNTWWKETTGPKKFNNRCYSSLDGTKFAIVSGIPPTDADHTISPISTLETSIFNTLGLTMATLEFDQAYFLELGAWIKIELSLDSGSTYPILLDPGGSYNFTGPSSSIFDDTIEGGQCNNSIEYTYLDNHVSIDLSNYIGQTGLRIKFTYSGTANSAWALENISIPQAPINEVIEWTDDNGNVVTTGSSVNISPITPGIQSYGVTSLINNCRASGNEGTEFITINASSAFAGENITPLPGKCGESEVILGAYDNTLTAIQNFNNGVWDSSYTLPNVGNGDTDYPGTGEAGFWSVIASTGSCATSYNFSDINDPRSIFTANPGTYTLKWTVGSCSSTIDVTIDSCNGLDFDGVDDFVNFKDNYNLTTNFSFELWIKPESVSGTQTLFSKRDANSLNSGYDLKLTNDIISFNWNNTGSILSSPHKITTNRWYHIAVTYNSGTYNLYVDGVLIKSSGGSLPLSNNLNCLIGAMDKTGDPTNYFSGWIDELRIWNKALTQAQIQQMMNQQIEDNIQVSGEIIPIEVNGLNWSDLQGYYRMNTNCGAIEPYAGTVRGKIQNVYSSQQETAPLPYTTGLNGSWDSNSTWSQPTVWHIPNSIGIDGVTLIDWNIVKTSNNINASRDISLLGLLIDSNELQINGSTTLGMNSLSSGNGYGLTVSHYLKINGVLDLEGESQLIQQKYTPSQFSESTFESSSTGTLQRDQQGVGNKYRYNDWSTPVQQIFNGSTFLIPGNNTYNISGVLRDGTNPANPVLINFINSLDGDNTSSPISISNNWLYAYTDFTHDDYWSWFLAGNSTILKVGEGFIMKGTGIPGSQDQNYVFEGIPNNGDITLNITADNDYLVGNPYPSALDANQFIIDNNGSITGTLYFWEHYGGNSHYLLDYQAGYASYNLSGGVAAAVHPINDPNAPDGTKIPGQFIAVAQAFFVQGKNIGDQEIKFKNSQRVFYKESGVGSIFMKAAKSKVKSLDKTKNSIDLRMKFRIDFYGPKSEYRQLLLTIDENATDEIDYGYDGEVFDYLESDMYWVIENKNFVIQGTNNFSINKEIPFGIETIDGGEIKIQVAKLENVNEKISIYIKDSFTGETYDLRQQPFEINLEAGEFLNRFSLVFQPRLKTLQEVNIVDGFYLNMDNNYSELSIRKIVETDIKSIHLFNYLGQKTDSWNKNLTSRLITLPINNKSAGVYILHINTINGQFMQKIIIE